MVSFYWWSIEWSRKSGTEDLDSLFCYFVFIFYFSLLIGEIFHYFSYCGREINETSIMVTLYGKTDTWSYKSGVPNLL